MKVNEILNEAGDKYAEQQAHDKAWREEQRAKKTPEENAANDAKIAAAEKKHKEWVESRKGTNCGTGKHEWGPAKSTPNGQHTYKCKNCDQTKKIDSGD